MPSIFTSTQPTCTLQVQATPSPLARWTDRPLVGDLSFRLLLEPPIPLPTSPQAITLLKDDTSPAVASPVSPAAGVAAPTLPKLACQVEGDGAQLQSLATVVETYVQKMLSGGLVESAPVPAADSTPDSPSEPPAEPAKESRKTDDAAEIALQPLGLVSHQLHLGSLQNSSVGKTVTMTATQLFDLTSALSAWSEQMAMLPSTTSRPGFQLPNLPIWLKSTAVAAAVLAASALALQWLQSGGPSGQIARETAAPRPNTAPPPAVARAPEGPPLDENPEAVPNSPTASNSPSPGASPSPTGSPVPNPISPAVGSPTPRTQGQPTLNLPPPQATKPGANIPSGFFVPRDGTGNYPIATATPRPGSTSSPPPVSRPVPPPQRAEAPPPPASVPPSPALAPSTAEAPPTPARGREPILESARPRPNSGNPTTGDANSGFAAGNPPPTASPRPARVSPSALSAAPPPAPAAQPAPNVPPNNYGRSSNAPQVVAVRDYFARRWQPPAGLEQTLEYDLVLNPDGSLQQVTANSKAAKNYLGRPPFPLSNKPFAPPSSSPTRLRLILQQNGRVDVLEGG
jgi:hypothetical protein